MTYGTLNNLCTISANTPHTTPTIIDPKTPNPQNAVAKSKSPSANLSKVPLGSELFELVEVDVLKLFELVCSFFFLTLDPYFS